MTGQSEYALATKNYDIYVGKGDMNRTQIRIDTEAKYNIISLIVNQLYFTPHLLIEKIKIASEYALCRRKG